MIEYWHWHTLHFGTETYWGGVLPHNGRPGRVYRELAALGEELAAAGDLGRVPHPGRRRRLPLRRPQQVGAPGAAAAGRRRRRPGQAVATRPIFDAFYRGAFDAGLQSRRPATPGAAPRTPICRPCWSCPAYYAADDAVLDRLQAYAEAGGHLVLGPRTGYGDHEARARTGAPARAPGRARPG